MLRVLLLNSNYSISGGTYLRITQIKLHNFRAYKDEVEVELNPYSIIVGANNSGKTSFLTALRILYGDDRLKFEAEDLPFDTEDKESWIEAIYSLPDSEFDSLPNKYKSKNNTFRIRKSL